MGQRPAARGYWRDVGTVDSYFDAHMDLCALQPVFNLYNSRWPILTHVPAQLTSIADSIAAQRHSIEALKAQLPSFDEQLAALEQILGPLAQWSSTWAELEKRLLNTGHGPQSRGRASGSSPDSSLPCRRDYLGFAAGPSAAHDVPSAEYAA